MLAAGQIRHRPVCLTGLPFEALALRADHVFWILGGRDTRFEDTESLQRAARQQG